jgi:hypothetical protein
MPAQRKRHLGLSLMLLEEWLLQVIYQYLLLHLKDLARWDFLGAVIARFLANPLDHIYSNLLNQAQQAQPQRQQGTRQQAPTASKIATSSSLGGGTP